MSSRAHHQRTNGKHTHKTKLHNDNEKPQWKKDLPKDFMKYVEESHKDPRIFQTHLPLSMLPPNVLVDVSKVVEISRNPKDVCTSMYRHGPDANVKASSSKLINFDQHGKHSWMERSVLQEDVTGDF